MAASPPFKFPMSSPGPLNPLSPERLNASANRHTPYSPRSPPMPIFDGTGPSLSQQNSPISFAAGFGSPPKSHVRTHSDVQGMVARFNSLDIKDYTEASKSHKAALRRAQLGREEAEADLSKAREETRRLKKENDEGREREMKVMKRLDVVMEELHRAKETQTHAQGLYEKEIRKARKEAFRASSALVKLQEEVKSARNSYRAAQTDLETEKAKVRQRDEDVFNAEYRLVGVQQNLEQAQTAMQVVIDERDALKTSLKEEEVARIAAEGLIALPPSKEEDDEFSSPKKKTPQPPRFLLDRTADRPRTPSEAEHFKAELRKEQRRRSEAEDQIEFMKMECQFKCCSCRVAENRGDPFVHDLTHYDGWRHFKDQIASSLTKPETIPATIKIEDELMQEATLHPAHQRPTTPAQADVEMAEALEARQEVKFSPDSGTFRRGTPARPRLVTPTPDDDDDEDVDDAGESVTLQVDIARSTTPLDHRPATEVRHIQSELEPGLNRASQVTPPITSTPSLRLVPDQNVPPTPATSYSAPQQKFTSTTTTTTIPLADEDSGPRVFDFGMGDMTREEAIEKMRERRGRARSITGTPKKPAVTTEAKAMGKTPRRDISAPELRKTPKSMPKMRT